MLIRTQLMDRARDFNIILDDVAITELSFGREYAAAVESKQVQLFCLFFVFFKVNYFTPLRSYRFNVSWRLNFLIGMSRVVVSLTVGSSFKNAVRYGINYTLMRYLPKNPKWFIVRLFFCLTGCATRSSKGCFRRWPGHSRKAAEDCPGIFLPVFS